MGRPRLKVKGYTIEDIENLISRDERYTIGLRLHVVYNVAKGYSRRTLEEIFGFSFKQITHWVHRFENEGIDGLRDKPKSGRKKRLSDGQLTQLASVIGSESPTLYGYNSETWTGPLVSDWIEKQFQVTFKKAQIYNIIRSLGFTYQRTKGIYPEADPAKQEVFKETLKKLLSSPEDAILLFEDEFSLSNSATIGRKWSLKGIQPQVLVKQRGRERLTGMGRLNFETGQMTVTFEETGT